MQLWNKIGYVLSGIAIGAMIMVIPVDASSLKQKIEVMFNVSKVTVNDTNIVLKDSKGSSVKPIEYNGTFYLPLTNESLKALQVESAVDKKNQVVKLTSPFAMKDVKVFNDESMVELKDSNGNKAQIFSYKGSIYMPIESLGKSLNTNVQWDGKTNSLYIGKRSSTKTPDIWLKDMEYLNITNDFELSKLNSDSFKDNTGKSYKNGIVIGGTGVKIVDSKYRASVTYLLDQKYSRFTGNYVLPVEYKNQAIDGTGPVIRIYGDDQLLYTSTEMKAGSLPEAFDIDVKGVMKLKIECYDYWFLSDERGINDNMCERALTDVGFYEK